MTSYLRTLYSPQGLQITDWDTIRNQIETFISNGQRKDSYENLINSMTSLGPELIKNRENRPSKDFLQDLSEYLEQLKINSELFATEACSSNVLVSKIETKYLSHFSCPRLIQLISCLFFSSQYSRRNGRNAPQSQWYKKTFARCVVLTTLLVFSINKQNSLFPNYLASFLVSHGLSRLSLNTLSFFGLTTSRQTQRDFQEAISNPSQLYRFVSLSLEKFLSYPLQSRELSCCMNTDNVVSIQRSRVFHEGTKSCVFSGQANGLILSTETLDGRASKKAPSRSLSTSSFFPSNQEKKAFDNTVVEMIKRFWLVAVDTDALTNEKSFDSQFTLMLDTVDPMPEEKYRPKSIGFFAGVSISEHHFANSQKLMVKGLKHSFETLKYVFNAMGMKITAKEREDYKSITHDSNSEPNSSFSEDEDDNEAQIEFDDSVFDQSFSQSSQDAGDSKDLTNSQTIEEPLKAPPLKKVKYNKDSAKEVFITFSGDQSTQAGIQKAMKEMRLPPGGFFLGIWHLSYNLHDMVLHSFDKYVDFKLLRKIVNVSTFNLDYFKRGHNALVHVACGYFLGFFCFHCKNTRNFKQVQEILNTQVRKDATTHLWVNMAHCILINHALHLPAAKCDLDLVSSLMKIACGMFHSWSHKVKYQNLCARQIAHLELSSPMERLAIESSSLSIHSVANLYIENGVLYSTARPMHADEFNENLVYRLKSLDSHTHGINEKTVNSMVGLSFLENQLFSLVGSSKKNKRRAFGLCPITVMKCARAFLGFGVDNSKEKFPKNFYSLSDKNSITVNSNQKVKVKWENIEKTGAIHPLVSVDRGKRRAAKTVYRILNAK